MHMAWRHPSPAAAPGARCVVLASAAALLALSAAARAEAVFPARYRVVVAGMPVLDVEARVELGAETYHLSARLRTRGLVALAAPGEHVSEASGGLRGTEAEPWRYLSEGIWRGRPRRLALDWHGGEPVLRLRDPPGPDEHEPVPPELRRGTLDALSALVQLARIVAATGRCEAAAAVYDGRRRMDYVLHTAGRGVLPPWRDAWAGEALRCGFEGRQVAGFRRDRDASEQARPQRGEAWLAPLVPGGPHVPVRLSVPTPRLGTVEAYLVAAAALPPR
jgi:hypothetical protein